MTRLPLLLSALLCTVAISCAEDDDDEGSETNNTTNNTSNNTTTNTSSNDVSTGEEVCESSHQCVNDVCECTTPGKEMQPCDDDTACEAQCEVCM